MTLFGPNGAPVGPTPAQQGAAAIGAELRLGRMALRMLAYLVSEHEGRKVSVQKKRLVAFQAKYPGAVIRFGEELERVTMRVMTPDELDAADAEVAKKNRQDQAIADGALPTEADA